MEPYVVTLNDIAPSPPIITTTVVKDGLPTKVTLAASNKNPHEGLFCENFRLDVLLATGVTPDLTPTSLEPSQFTAVDMCAQQLEELDSRLATISVAQPEIVPPTNTPTNE